MHLVGEKSNSNRDWVEKEKDRELESTKGFQKGNSRAGNQTRIAIDLREREGSTRGRVARDWSFYEDRFSIKQRVPVNPDKSARGTSAREPRANRPSMADAVSSQKKKNSSPSSVYSARPTLKFISCGYFRTAIEITKVESWKPDQGYLAFPSLRIESYPPGA